MSSLSGAELDKAYMQHMVEDHTKDVAEFEKTSTSATDADLRGWATKTLPTLREHLATAKDLAGAGVGKGATCTSPRGSRGSFSR
ncbi:MAG: DUF4142 domain-containing protein [Thermoanaerobaculia bacterium]